MSDYLLYFRLWPGFTHLVPYAEFNLLPDEELRAAFHNECDRNIEMGDRVIEDPEAEAIRKIDQLRQEEIQQEIWKAKIDASMSDGTEAAEHRTLATVLEAKLEAVRLLTSPSPLGRFRPCEHDSLLKAAKLGWHRLAGLAADYSKGDWPWGHWGGPDPWSRRVWLLRVADVTPAMMGDILTVASKELTGEGQHYRDVGLAFSRRGGNAQLGYLPAESLSTEERWPAEEMARALRTNSSIDSISQWITGVIATLEGRVEFLRRSSASQQAPDGQANALAASQRPELPLVDLITNQVRYDGQCHDVTADGALLLCKLVEAFPLAMSASNLFSKPSRVKAALPESLKTMIVAETGKGYRLNLG